MVCPVCGEDEYEILKANGKNIYIMKLLQRKRMK